MDWVVYNWVIGDILKDWVVYIYICYLVGRDSV